MFLKWIIFFHYTPPPLVVCQEGSSVDQGISMKKNLER